MSTATDLVNALDRHYTGGPGHRDQDAWATWQELQSPNARRIDYLALALWGSRGRDLIGHEIKVSRADWLNELAQPSKAEQWWQACNRWYLVVPHASLVHDGELPPGWGLMVPPPANRRSMKVVVEAPRKPVEVPHWLTTAMVKRDRYSHAEQLRRAVSTAKHEARDSGYAEGKAALERQVGRIITRAEQERLDVLKMIEDLLGVPIDRYAFTSQRDKQIEPATAALALQVARAIQDFTGPTYNSLDQLLTRVGLFADAATGLRAAQAELSQLLVTGEAA